MAETSYETLRRLSDIVKSKVTFTFDTLEDMRKSVYLHETMTVKTLGYYSLGDGGGAYYYVEKKSANDVDNECDSIIVGYQKDLVARYLPMESTLNVLQFGVIQGSTNYDIRFNEERIKYCEDYCVTKGLGILYNNKAAFKGSHRFGLVNCPGIITQASTTRAVVRCSVPLPVGLTSQPMNRGMIIKGTYGVYRSSSSIRTGTLSSSMYTAKCNGFCIDTTITLTGNFTVSDSTWSVNSPVTVQLDVKDMELKDEILSD